MKKSSIKVGFEARNKEIGEALSAREKLIKSGNSTSEVDKHLEELFQDFFYSPKLAVREEYLVNKENKTDEEIAELKDIVEYKNKIQANSYLLDFNKQFEEKYGKRIFKVMRTLKGSRGFNGKIMYNEYFLPSSLRNFIVTPWDSLYNPNNVFQIIVRDFETEINKIDAKEIIFLSLMFDENINEYKKHYWKVIVQFEGETVVEEAGSDEDELA